MKDTQTKIDSLTSDQEKLMEVVRNEWISHGLSCKPLNREKVISAVNKSYECSGLDAPSEVVFVQSPIKGNGMATDIDGKGRKYIVPFHGQHESGWLSFYDYFIRIGLDDDIKIIEGLIELSKEAGWVWLFDDIAIVCERPKSIHLNEAGRLHNENGMALEYSDGWGVYCLNGVRFEHRHARIFSEDYNLTIEDIDSFDNTEQRRALIEVYGWQEYFDDSGADLIDEGIDNLGQEQKLWAKDIGEDERVVILQVTNSTPEPDGSFKKYTLRVPPNMKNAEQAKMWTFGVEDGGIEWGNET